jgi:hypothetical protein
MEMAYSFIRGALGSNHAREVGYPNCGFPQFLQKKNASINPRPLSSNYLVFT